MTSLPPIEPTERRSRLGLGRIVLPLVIAGAIAGGAYLYRRRPAPTQDAKEPVHKVGRSSLLVSINEGGTLNAVNDVTVKSEVTGTVRIISIVPEGSYVKKGDLLVELDSSGLIDQLSQEEIKYEGAVAAYEQAKEDIEIKASQNESNTRDAELKIEFAGSDLKKYREGTWPLERKKAEADIAIAEAELKRGQDRLAWTEKLSGKGYATRSEFEADRLTVTRNELELGQARDRLRLLDEYDNPLKIKRFEADLRKASEEAERVRHRAASELARVQSDFHSKKATLELLKQQLEDRKEQIKKTKISAPQDGLVVYASSVSRRRGSQEEIQEGATVRERQELVKLPDTSKMKVGVKVHESRMNQLREGQLAYVTLDALPERRFKGYVGKISLLPDSQSRWLNPGLKVYGTDVIVDEELPEGTKPGLSARCEIIIAKLDDVMAVPLQAVTTRKKQQVCYRLRGLGRQAVPVKVGMYNDTMIEILSGLEEGDRILLEPPPAEESLEVPMGIVKADEVATSTAADLEALKATASTRAKEMKVAAKAGAEGGSSQRRGRRSRGRPSSAEAK